ETGNGKQNNRASQPQTQNARGRRSFNTPTPTKPERFKDKNRPRRKVTEECRQLEPDWPARRAVNVARESLEVLAEKEKAERSGAGPCVDDHEIGRSYQRKQDQSGKQAKSFQVRVISSESHLQTDWHSHQRHSNRA